MYDSKPFIAGIGGTLRDLPGRLYMMVEQMVDFARFNSHVRFGAA